MPYESTAQQAYMHIHHPEIAKRWDKETSAKQYEHLPEHKGDGSDHLEALKKQGERLRQKPETD